MDVRVFKRTHQHEADYEFMEYACVEGERAIDRIFGFGSMTDRKVR